MSKKFTILLTVLASVLIVLFLSGCFIGNYFYNLAINSKTDKSKVFEAPCNHVQLDFDKQEVKDTYGDLTKEEVYIKAFDNLTLHSSLIKNKSPTDKWVIVCHGYGGAGSNVQYLALKYYKLGYNIIVPDLRGCGSSEGDYLGMGWFDRLDVIAWIKHLLTIEKNAKINLYGISMGGATVMAVSGEDLPSNVKTIIEDSGYTSLWDEFSYQLKNLYGLPNFPFLNLASMMTKFRAGYTFEEVDITKQIAKSKTPMLFIHGDKDTFVPPYMLERAYNAAKVPKEKLIIEGAGHVESASVNPTLYWNTITQFIDTYS